MKLLSLIISILFLATSTCDAKGGRRNGGGGNTRQQEQTGEERPPSPQQVSTVATSGPQEQDPVTQASDLLDFTQISLTTAHIFKFFKEKLGTNGALREDSEFKVSMGDGSFRGAVLNQTVDHAQCLLPKIVKESLQLVECSKSSFADQIKDAHSKHKEGLLWETYPLILGAPGLVLDQVGTTRESAALDNLLLVVFYAKDTEVSLSRIGDVFEDGGGYIFHAGQSIKMGENDRSVITYSATEHYEYMQQMPDTMDMVKIKKPVAVLLITLAEENADALTKAPKDVTDQRNALDGW